MAHEPGLRAKISVPKDKADKINQIIQDVSTIADGKVIPKLPEGVKGQVIRPKSKVTVVNEKNRIVRYDDILSDSDYSPKAVESRSRQQYKDAFS